MKMKYISFLLIHACFANMLQLDVGTEPGLPSCASRCMVDSMFVTPCLDMTCLCREKEYQRSLFQCLFSQCDPSDYGSALSRTIAVCMDTGAEIHLAAPASSPADRELLRAREADYLAGRPALPDVPGLLHLRQDSAAPTATVTVTDLVTMTLTLPDAEQDLSPAITPFATTTAAAAAGAAAPAAAFTGASTPDRPWMITRSAAVPTRGRHPRAASLAGLVLCFGFVLMQDYWING